MDALAMQLSLHDNLLGLTLKYLRSALEGSFVSEAETGVDDEWFGTLGGPNKNRVLDY